MKPVIVEGDIVAQDVDVIVNAWNRNIIPWWLLWPHGVSGAIKKRGGTEPFRELARYGPIPLGEAVFTGAGALPFKGIIHVAGINMFWMATQYSIRNSTKNAMNIVCEKGFGSVAFPLIGAGAGGYAPEKVLEMMAGELEKIDTSAVVKIVIFNK
jgi:O-acetyl-ADP-ribose deacetylase (regulator of RNase III)